MLLDHVMKIALINNKVVVVSTLNAVGFYTKNGFVEVERKTTRRGNIDLPCVYMELKPSLKEKS